MSSRYNSRQRYQFAPYVPVAKRHADAKHQMEKLEKQGQVISPVKPEGRTIAKSFWGKSWCENLERYSDYENRLPRGRTYVRNGSVLDLQIKTGEITAMVSGSDIYKISIKIDPVAKPHWGAVCSDCAGSIGSLVELLQGKLSKSVMERVCRKGDGLFPSPQEIKLSCSCPDWATMCKHVAAAMYGVGTRLDSNPELLFTLRAVNEDELIAKASANLPLAGQEITTSRALQGEDVSALFGIDMEDEVPAAATHVAPKTVKALKSKKMQPLAKKLPATKPRKSSPAKKTEKVKATTQKAKTTVKTTVKVKAITKAKSKAVTPPKRTITQPVSAKMRKAKKSPEIIGW